MPARRAETSRKKSPSSRKSSKELPRKAAKIRRTFSEPGVEKTELRFVLYSEPSGKYQRDRFLQEVAEFFLEQAKRMADEQQLQKNLTEEPVKKKETPCTIKCPFWEGESKRESDVPLAKDVPVKENRVEHKCGDSKTDNGWMCMCQFKEEESKPEPGVVLVKDVFVKECHHEQNCQRARALRTSLPVVKKLIDRVRQLSTRYRNEELSAILRTAEQVYRDSEKCLKEGGPVGESLLDRILRLNQIGTKVLENPEKKPAVSSSSLSNVNAVSHADSSIKLNRRRRR